ncbi:MAG TPA: hypothetical protein VHO25_17825 [Polyangiaceae bacterium]|nr:hypothetical protein [Polyangiaceae bacterium]
MKPLILALLLLLAFPVYAQVKLKTKYDKFKDETSISIPLQYVDMKSPGRLEASAYINYKAKGEQVIIGLGFFSSSRSWRFLGSPELNAIIDGERVGFGKPVSRDSEVVRYGVEESISYAITPDQLSKLARASTIEMQIGHVEFRLKDKFVEALRNLQSSLPAAN